MADADDIRDAAATEAAAGIKSVTTDGSTVVGRDLDELYEAANREDQRTAATRKHFGLRITQLRSPGAN